MKRAFLLATILGASIAAAQSSPWDGPWGGSGGGGSGGGGSGTPGGSDTHVQFNDGGAFGGDAGFTYNKTTDSATLTGDLAVNGGDITTSASTLNIGASVTTTTVNGGSGSTGCTATDGSFACSADITAGGDLGINGGDISTTSAGFGIANSNATTIDIGNAATTVRLNGGSASTGCTATNGDWACSGTVSASTSLRFPVTGTLPTCASGSDTGLVVFYIKGSGGTEQTSMCGCEELAGTFGWAPMSTSGDCT